MKIDKIKLVGYAGMVALLASMILSLLGYSNSTKHMDRIKNELLETQVKENVRLKMEYIDSAYGQLTQGEGTLLDSSGDGIRDCEAGGMDSILKNLKDKCAIFVREEDEFRSISTNIKINNEVVEGNPESSIGRDHKAYETVINGDLYLGEVEIADEIHYAAYEPIKDKNENVIGLLFVGTKTEELDEIIKKNDTEMNRINIAVTILRTISLGSLIALVSVSVVSGKSGNN